MVAVPLGPAQVDITGVRAGDRNEFQITLTSAGRGLDVTGMTFKATAKLTKSDAAGVDAVITITDAPNGVVKLRWPGDAVRTWMGSATTVKGLWDMQMTSGTNDPLTVVAGEFSAEMDVTR